MSDLTKRILLGLGLGAAVVTPLAITYYLTRDEWQLQDLRREGRSGLEGRASKPKDSTLLVTIRSDAVGAVIGRGGEVVRRIQDETSTRIDFREDKFKKGDKVATIRGSPDAVLDAEAYIHRIIAKQPVTYHETFFIPIDFVARVIGKNGEVIHGIADSTGTKIDVARNPPLDAPGTPVTIKGTIENIRRAKKQIDEIIGSDSGRPSRNSFNKSRSDSFNKSGSDSFNKSRSDSFKVQRKTYTPKVNGSAVKPGTEELVPTQDGHLQVYVSTARSPSKFWVQIFGTRSNELDKMTESMTDFYEEKRNLREYRLVEANVGDIVAAPFNMDESWYRVRIVGVESDSRIRVYYLDFGDEGIHPRESLCSLKPEYLTSLPFQAVECCLAGVSPIVDSWSDDAIKFFCDLTHAGNWIELKAFPVEKIHSVVSVDLLDFKDQSCPINIADELVSRGFAIKTNPE